MMQMTLNETKPNCYACIMYHSRRCYNRTFSEPCEKFVLCTGYQVRRCIRATTSRFQDGYIHCPVKRTEKCKCETSINFEYNSNDSQQNYNVTLKLTSNGWDKIIDMGV